MISCAEHQAAMVALFDNEAGDEDLRLAAGHLRDCPECRAFSRELIGIRRTLASAPLPSPTPTVGKAVLDCVENDLRRCGESGKARGASSLQRVTLTRWAAVLVIGVLAITCLVLSKTAQDLKRRLGAAEQQVATIHEQRQMAEAQERQQKAISALYFRMAEIESRVNRFSPSQRTSVPSQGHERPKAPSNL